VHSFQFFYVRLSHIINKILCVTVLTKRTVYWKANVH